MNQTIDFQPEIFTNYLQTNHIYAGSDRIASQVIPVNYGSYSPAIYYYGKDNLGSTTYLTDGMSNIAEHMEYTPWGESWMEQTSTFLLPNFKFTGKELDASGLYYFGARYYEPQISAWLSADPILNKYISGKGSQGGVYNSINLNSYNYAHQNPVSKIDPNGKNVYAPPGGLAKGSYYKVYNNGNYGFEYSGKAPFNEYIAKGGGLL